jgi:hypothetical protein
MPIKLELFGDTVGQLIADLEALLAAIRPLVHATAAPVTVETPATAPGDELRAVIEQHVEAEGYEATVVERAPEPTEPKKPARKGRRPLAAVDEALKTLKSNGGGKPEPERKAEPEPKPEPQEDPEGDKKFVVEKLGALVKDPTLKPKVFVFAAQIAKQNGVGKVSELPTPLFPAIRRAMEQEFGES